MKDTVLKLLPPNVPVTAAVNVTAEPIVEALEGITSLPDKSLLVAKPQTHDEVRFGMLEVVREYALDRLEASGEAESIRCDHAAHFLGIAEEAEEHLHGRQPAKWLRRLEEEHDNMRAALRWWLATTRQWRRAWTRRFDTFGFFRDTWRKA